MQVRALYRSKVGLRRVVCAPTLPAYCVALQTAWAKQSNRPHKISRTTSSLWRRPTDVDITFTYTLLTLMSATRSPPSVRTSRLLGTYLYVNSLTIANSLWSSTIFNGCCYKYVRTNLSTSLPKGYLEITKRQMKSKDIYYDVLQIETLTRSIFRWR